MSDKPISVGDLVMVVRSSPCRCGKAHDLGPGLGAIFTAGQIRMSHGFKCAGCGTKFPEEMITETGVTLGASHVVMPLYRLKRIPPLGDLKGISEDARRPKKRSARSGRFHERT